MTTLIYKYSHGLPWSESMLIGEYEGFVTREALTTMERSQYVRSIEWSEYDHAYRILLTENTLTTLPLLYGPFIITMLRYSDLNANLRFMFSVLVSAFPDAIGHVPGMDRHMIGRPDSRDLYLSRLSRSWSSKRSKNSLTEYVWRKWMEVTGDGSLGPMPRSAPNGNNIVGPLVSDWTRSAKRKSR
jgi:hypothetical protein